MPSMFDSATRAEYQRRIASLTPSMARKWGRISAQQMVCHLSDQVRMALGEIPTTPIPGPMRYWPIKHLVIGPLPWPHGAKSPPESWTSRPGEFEGDKTTLRELLERFGSRAPQSEWPDHPLFGNMTRELWGQLTCKHFNHHLTQFGA